LSDADPRNAFDVGKYLSTDLSPKPYELYYTFTVNMEKEDENDDEWEEDDSHWTGDEPLDIGAFM